MQREEVEMPRFPHSSHIGGKSKGHCNGADQSIKVELVKYIQGYSTTNIIEKIKEIEKK